MRYTYPGGLEALRGLTLDIPAGARIAILGQNGAGKSTLIKHLNGLIKPAQGSVQIGDWNTRDHTIAQLAARVGLVFQNPDDQLFKTRVWDEVAFGPQNLKGNPAEVERRVANALALCGLEAQRAAHPYDLPLWQRRWVAIGSVVAMETPIVVLDEPTTGQDAFGVERLTRLLDYWRERGVTVLAVTHDVDLAVEQFPELLIMAQGQVIARGNAGVLSDESVAAQAGLDAPQLMRLARALQWHTLPTNVSEFVETLTARLSDRANSP